MRLAVVREILRYAVEKGKAPVILLLLLVALLGLLVVLTESAAVMPFIYSLY